MSNRANTEELKLISDKTGDTSKKRPLQGKSTDNTPKRRRWKYDPPIKNIEPHKRRPLMSEFSYVLCQVNAPENISMIQRMNQIWLLSYFLRSDTPVWRGWNSHVSPRHNNAANNWIYGKHSITPNLISRCARNTLHCSENRKSVESSTPLCIMILQ